MSDDAAGPEQSVTPTRMLGMRETTQLLADSNSCISSGRKLPHV